MRSNLCLCPYAIQSIEMKQNNNELKSNAKVTSPVQFDNVQCSLDC